MEEVRCKDCEKLLGRFEGKFEIKCTRCGAVNRGNTNSQEQKVIRKVHIPLNKRQTSSGVTFR